jgi:Xaa-Pro aminopeptidase
MDRRQFLGTATATSVTAMAAAAATVQAAQAGETSVKIVDKYIKSDLGKKIPVNKARAYEVLDELKIDGLIALRPHNIYYLTNTTPTLIAFGNEFPAFATFAKDPSQPSFLVSSNGNSWETANGDREVPPVITFSGPANWQEYINATPEKMKVEPISAATANPQAVAAGAKLTKREAGWKHAQDTLAPASGATPEWALVHALKQSGLTKGRIAVDDMRIAWLLQRIGFDGVTFIPGDNVFRKIRHVKTDYEISMMRVAQAITQKSVTTAARALEPGMTFDEFQLRFFTEATAMGAEPGFVLLGVTQGLLPDGVIKRGQSYMLDCSAHFKKYQGDFARTVVVGEPDNETKKRFKAQQVGREAAFAMIKAGVPFTKVEQRSSASACTRSACSTATTRPAWTCPSTRAKIWCWPRI